MAGAVVGQGTSKGRYVQRSSGNDRHFGCLQGRVQVETLPDSCRWLLRMDDQPGRQGTRPLAHIPARASTLQLRRRLGTQRQAPRYQLFYHHHASRESDAADTRQPAILDPEIYDTWLDPETPPGDAKQLLHENLDGDLEFYRVGQEVNTSAKDKQPYDLPSMIEPIAML